MEPEAKGTSPGAASRSAPGGSLPGAEFYTMQDSLFSF